MPELLTLTYEDTLVSLSEDVWFNPTAVAKAREFGRPEPAGLND